MTDPMLAVYKVDHAVTVTQNKYWSTPTTVINSKHKAGFDAVRYNPCQFQEFVQKKLEIRVTVIGERVFAAELYSQENKNTQVDWRYDPLGFNYKEAHLPPHVKDQCLAFVQSYGLNFSAIDLILTPDERYVFLENNPNGQFIFLEKQLPSLRMRDALADCLIAGRNV